MTAKQRATRDGFTLVELLMVIAIIAVLAALLLTAVNKVRGSIRFTTTTADMSQLEVSLGRFKETFNAQMPSHVLKPLTVGGQAVPARFAWPVDMTAPEAQLLRRMFPRWNPPTQTVTDGSGVSHQMLDFSITTGANAIPEDYRVLVRLTNPFAASALPWAGGASNPTAGAVAPIANVATPLDPNQLLVLLLGGPQIAFSQEAVAILKANGYPSFDTGVYSSGWDVASPYAPGASGAKKAPLHEFSQSKLVSDAVDPLPCPNGIPRFVDGWGMPYAFFAASAGDNYDPRVQFPWTSDAAVTVTFDPANDPNAPTAPPATPPSTKTFTAHPYRSSNKWLNPGRFQLLSAGPDKQYGPGVQYTVNGSGQVTALTDLWDAKNPQGGSFAKYYGEVTRGTDDLSNFTNGNNLGTGQ